MSVIVGYTTESGHSKGVFGVFDENISKKLGVLGGQLDKVRVPKSLGHAFELRQAINGEPSKGTKGALARREFDSKWAEPRVVRDDSWKKVRDASQDAA